MTRTANLHVRPARSVGATIALFGLLAVPLLLSHPKPSRAGDGGPPTTRGADQPSVRLVIGNDSLTFEGKPATWDQLPGLLEKVPDRQRTVLRIAPESNQVTPSRYRDALERAGALVRRYGFRYLGDGGAPAPPPPPVVGDGAADADRDDFVFVVGGVLRPGPYPLQRNGKAATLRDVVVAAMGDIDPSNYYGRPSVRVIHGFKGGRLEKHAPEISLATLLRPAPGEPVPDLPLHAGDILMILADPIPPAHPRAAHAP